MSAAERKPKSDAITATRLGPLPPECNRDDCPHRDDWEDMRQKVDEIHSAMFGTAQEPGYFERVRQLEWFRKVVIGVLVVIGSPVLGALGFGLVKLMAQ